MLLIKVPHKAQQGLEDYQQTHHYAIMEQNRIIQELFAKSIWICHHITNKTLNKTIKLWSKCKLLTLIICRVLPFSGVQRCLDIWLANSFIARCGLFPHYFKPNEADKKSGVDFSVNCHLVAVWLAQLTIWSILKKNALGG